MAKISCSAVVGSLSRADGDSGKCGNLRKDIWNFVIELSQVGRRKRVERPTDCMASYEVICQLTVVWNGGQFVALLANP
jgi:hypothetical protein